MCVCGYTINYSPGSLMCCSWLTFSSCNTLVYTVLSFTCLSCSCALLSLPCPAQPDLTRGGKLNCSLHKRWRERKGENAHIHPYTTASRNSNLLFFSFVRGDGDRRRQTEICSKRVYPEGTEKRREEKRREEGRHLRRVLSMHVRK